jgi:uncharacterized Tic20 family protein
VPATRRDRAATALVLGVAASAWFGWAQESPPSGWGWFLVAGSVGAALVAVVGGITTWRHRRGPSVMSDATARRTYNLTVAVEVVAILAGVVVLALAGASSYLAAWILFVVGVHFVPLARLFRLPGLTVTGLLCAAVAVGAAAVALAGTTLPSAPAGAGGGLVMAAYGVILLLGLRSRPSTDRPSTDR